MDITFNHQMRTLECWICGCLFALPEQLYLREKDGANGFHCPNGHLLGLGKGKVAELEEKLSEANLTGARLMTSWRAAQRENERLFAQLDKQKKKKK